MKRVTTLAALALAVAITASPALAADMPVKAPVSVAVSPSWTGCYLGGNVGYGWARKQWSLSPAGIDEGSDNPNGLLGGGQIGCDYQTGVWVFGIQGMFDWASLKADHLAPVIGPPVTNSTNIPWLATLTGRLGYAVNPNALLYVKGGGAWVKDKHVSASTQTESADVSRSGWTIGGGLEYMVAPNWALFIEYDYMDFGTKTTTFTPSLDTFSIKQNVQAVLVGLNWRWGGLR
jgi:outer membrane immunogenic protein